MKAIVCVKQVPDTSGKVAVKADGTLDRASMATITNPDDLNALEAALKLKDETGCEVVVVTMGPPPAEGMLRELLARGADKAVLVSGREFGGSDTFATSQILAAAVNKIGVGPEDVVFCGRQAIDGDTAQVGPQIAEKLHLPQVTYVADIQKDGNSLTVKRMLEDGYMMVKVQTPCLLTCIKELNQPRYMSVNGIFTCYDKPMEVFDYNALKDDPLIEVDTIGLKGSPTNVFKSFTPPQKGAGTMLTGDDTAAQLAGILAKKHLILGFMAAFHVLYLRFHGRTLQYHIYSGCFCSGILQMGPGPWIHEVPHCAGMLSFYNHPAADNIRQGKKTGGGHHTGYPGFHW